MIPLNLTIKPVLLDRIDSAYQKSPFATRLEFIRYLLDAALSEWERNNNE